MLEDLVDSMDARRKWKTARRGSKRGWRSDSLTNFDCMLIDKVLYLLMILRLD